MMVRFLIETGSESHTTSWQKCNAKFVGGDHDGEFLYQHKQYIVSQEWLQKGQDGVIQNARVVRTVYELPEGTDILIDYQGHERPEKFIIRLDPEQDVTEYEIGTSRLRTYTLKARYIIVRDLIQQAEESLKASQEEGF